MQSGSATKPALKLRTRTGDLSRHYVDDGDKERKQAYRNFSVMYQSIARSQLQTICSNNMTQGSIEQYFSTFKLTFLKGNRVTRLDELAEKLQKEFHISQKLFADCALHSGNKQSFTSSSKTFENCKDKISVASSSSKTRVVESKFRKGRKRRLSGYYASTHAQKQMKFVGVLPADGITPDATGTSIIQNVGACTSENTRNISAVGPGALEATKLSQVLHSEFYRHLNENAQKKVHDFATIIWNLIPTIETDFTKVAITICEFHKLSWLDLYTLSSAPSTSLFSAIKINCGLSGKGWLSKYVVDAFLFVLTEKANRKKSENFFGCLDCDQCAMIINERPIKNKTTFARTILANSNQLKNLIFLPLLVRRHFVLLCFCKASNCLTLYDSANRDHSEIILTMRIFVKFLQNFSQQEIIITEKSIINQPDDNSCGVCVCIAADAICEATLSKCPVENISLPPILQFRQWMAYSLYANSTTSNALIQKANIAAIDRYTVGIPNIGNSCWFNSVLQATASSIKETQRNASAPKLNFKESNLATSLTHLLNSSQIPLDLLQETIRTVCSECQFEFGQQQDAEEFFSRSEMPQIIKSHGISCEIEFQEIFHCNNCKSIQRSEIFPQFDLTLPSSIKTECSLQKLLTNFCDTTDIKKCNSCLLIGVHRRTITFQKLSQVLVICLNKITRSHEGLFSKSLNAIIPSQFIEFDHTQDRLSTGYRLTSVLVHTGDNQACGHYLCYNIIGKQYLQIISDKNVYFQTFKEGKSAIETNGYLFFYCKITSSPPRYVSESDSSDGAKISLPLKKRVLKRRNYPTASGNPCSVVWKTKFVEFKPTYSFQSKFSVEWKKENQNLLNFVKSNAIEIMSTPLDKAQKQTRFFRHYLFLSSRLREVKCYNNRLNFDSTAYNEEFFVDLSLFMRHLLCDEIVKQRVIENTKFGDAIMRQLRVGNLVFKKSCIDSKSELVKYLTTEYTGCCNEYLRHVLDVEAIIFFAMSQHDWNYETAAAHLGLTISKV